MSPIYALFLLLLTLSSTVNANGKKHRTNRIKVQQFLGPQNAARYALRMSPLQWDSKLARYAQRYANQRRKDCALKHSNGAYGENIFWGSGQGWSPAQAATAWVEERRWYDHSSNSCGGGQECGHYTQVVWRTTRRVGCAKVNCSGGKGVFMTCNYYPPGNYIVSGRSLRQILDGGLKDEMDKALLLIAKRPRSQLTHDNTGSTSKGGVLGASSGNDVASDSAPAVEPNEVANLESGEGPELIVRGKKRSRVDMGEDGTEKITSKRGQDPTRTGGVKSLTFTGLPGGDRPPVLQPENAMEPARFEVQSYERWTAGSHAPLQVFGAFDLPQDFSSYVDRARSDVADRCLTRAGRFLSDMTHIVREYRADVDGQWRSESLREMTALKEQRTVAEQRASDAERRVKELTLELENLRVDNRKATATIKQLTDELGKEKEVCGERQHEGDEMKSELERCRKDKENLANEVNSLKVKVTKGVEKIANGLEAGYGHCYARAVAAGLDMTGHSFDDFCADLAREASQVQN